AALVVLRAGALTGWLGSSGQIEGSQETAKNLLTEARTRFEALDAPAGAAEAHIELAWCYWREGAYDEARVTLREALSKLSDTGEELRAIALVRLGDVERAAIRLNDALRVLSEAAPLVEASHNHSLKGRFHNTLAVVLKNLGASEKRSDYIDRALVEFAAASYHFEQAGHTRFRARVENNLGFLFLRANRFGEAGLHLDRARRLFSGLKDHGSVAQVDETRARLLLAQGKNSDAERVVRAAVHVQEKGDEQSLLAESLTTYGTALARLGQVERARLVLQRATETAALVGDNEKAGLAAITILEELNAHLSNAEAATVYERAAELLSDSQHLETLLRLLACSRHAFSFAGARRTEFSTTDFVYASDETAQLLRTAHRVAESDAAVLITGETGTGKEILAHLIHQWSGRAGSFVALNCGALTETLVESQLFGHRKGSFTDAVDDHEGLAQAAAGGTLFLDEVAELSLGNQSKLLRLIEYGEIHTVGAPHPEHVDVRIVAATNRDLKAAIAKKRFRDDLYYRLQTFHLVIPPLRERPEDIPAIAEHFTKQILAATNKRVTFTPEALEAMKKLPLKGNARELRSLLERTIIIASDGEAITAQAVETVAMRQTQTANLSQPWFNCSLPDEVLLYEAKLIRQALEMSGGSVMRAARLLGISHQTLSFILQGRHKNL
ncbi:MAG TPA: sigma-54 dependent transcriptional regulator, partial [Pyrinomonadaceae bacterium]|nr:sigma-54 dependent transcriptional regulator [Pyrinomonadaceae bacterium]